MFCILDCSRWRETMNEWLFLGCLLPPIIRAEKSLYTLPWRDEVSLKLIMQLRQSFSIYKHIDYDTLGKISYNKIKIILNNVKSFSQILLLLLKSVRLCDNSIDIYLINLILLVKTKDTYYLLPFLTNLYTIALYFQI